jgi:mono/diheme cytochrome c family protein
MRIELKELFLTLTVSLNLLWGASGASPLSQPNPAQDNRQSRTNAVPAPSTAIVPGEAKRGYGLFDHNCAPCHGEDARGDEGPSLFDLAKSDARIATVIKNGVKSEMPSFVRKFNDADIQALIAYLRTLKDRTAPKAER